MTKVEACGAKDCRWNEGDESNLCGREKVSIDTDGKCMRYEGPTSPENAIKQLWRDK